MQDAWKGASAVLAGLSWGLGVHRLCTIGAKELGMGAPRISCRADCFVTGAAAGAAGRRCGLTQWWQASCVWQTRTLNWMATRYAHWQRLCGLQVACSVPAACAWSSVRSHCVHMVGQELPGQHALHTVAGCSIGCVLHRLLVYAY
jgi:hypothetical protein